MKITIDTKWIECLEDFDTETKVALYEAIFDYMSDKEDVRLPDDTWMMFAILQPMLDEEKFKRLRLSERSRENGKKGGRKPIIRNPQEPKKPNRLSLYDDENRSDVLKKFDGWIKANAPYVYANLEPLTEKEFESLRDKYNSKQIADTIEQIENRKDLRKRYKNLYRTLLNWLKTNYGLP